MDVIELRNPQALAKGDIQQLIRRAVEAGPFLAPHGFDIVAPDIFQFVTDPRQFMFLGAEEGKFKCVVLGFLPTGNLFPYPTIVLFYNEGSRALSRLVQERLLDHILSNGYTRILAINGTGHSDTVWLKALTPEGVHSEIAGSLAFFEVK